MERDEIPFMKLACFIGISFLSPWSIDWDMFRILRIGSYPIAL
jgi:hypothetical protein